MRSKTEANIAETGGARDLSPRLRFPGFTVPWANEPLARVLFEHKLKNADGRDVFSVSMESGVVNQIEHLGRSFAASDTSNYNVGRRFDVVYTRSPLKAFPYGIVKQCKFDGEVALSPLYGVFTPTNHHVGLMVEAYFESPSRASAFLAPLCQKGAKNTLQITNATFLSGCLPLPTESAEQQKIADCLSSVDELIAAQARKVDALKTYKKGLLQQFFPREGETQPRLRFPEFRDAGEWEEKPLEELATYENGKAYEQDIIDDGKYVVVNSRFISTDGAVRKYTNADYLTADADDVLMVLSDLPKGRALAKCYFVEEGDRYAVNQRICRLKAKQLHPKFLFFTLDRNPGLLAYDDGQNQTHLSKGSVLACLMLVSPSNEEQQRIADCLTSLDHLIAAQSRKLEALKTYKKGLMQQLFPSVGEADA